MPAAQRSIVIAKPLKEVFGVIRDYESYPEFLPEVKAAHIAHRRGHEVHVQYEIQMIRTIRYTLRQTEEPPNRISWTFVEGEVMRDNCGHWELEEAGEGKTRATYTIEVKLGPLVPKSIVDALVGGSLPKMLEAFKKRAESAT